MYRHPNREHYLESLSTRPRGRAWEPRGGRGAGGRSRSRPRFPAKHRKGRRGGRMRGDAEGTYCLPASLMAAFQQGRLSGGFQQGGQAFLSARNGKAGPRQRRKPAQKRQPAQPAQPAAKAGPRPRRPAQIAKTDYAVYQLIRDKLKPLRDFAKKADAHLDAAAKQAMGLEAILQQAAALADDLMAGRGFFAGRDAKYLPGAPLRYLHNGRSTADLDFPEGKVPDYLSKFDQAMRGTSAESGQAQAEAVYEFMEKLQKSIRKAVNAQSSRKRREEQREKAAENMAQAAHVEKGDYREVMQEVVDKILRSSAEELKAMKMTDAMNKSVPLQIVLRLAGELGEQRLNWENFQLYIAAHHNGHFHFITSRAARFKLAIKRAKTILYNQKKRAEDKGLPHAAPAAAPAVPKPSPGLAQRLVSMRYD